MGSKIISLKQARCKLCVVTYHDNLSYDKSARNRDLFAHFENLKLRSRSSKPKSARPLPHWLLVNKPFLRKAKSILNKDAHYVLSTYIASSTVP